jgi:23S rRNA (adenine2503-C2)-methyltransferase
MISGWARVSVAARPARHRSDHSGESPMEHLLELSPEQFAAWLAQRRLPTYRAAQVDRWLFHKRAAGWQEMTDLSKPLRTQFASQLTLWTTRVARHTKAVDGTEKLLLELSDGETIEAVLLRDPVRRTLCVSTQVGCGMGCVFCASGLGGLRRNLTSGEIVEQMLRLQQLLDADERVSHIVIMGMGEPLANLDGLLPALATACNPHRLAVSARRITISTVGLPQAMRRLTEEAPHYRLAVSLHAPNDRLRDTLVPVSRKIGLQAVLREADRYFAASGRRLTFEYVLLCGINDRPEHARQLAQRLAGRTALLNVIPYNPVPGLPYTTPHRSAQSEFRSILKKAGVRVKFRQRKGDAIDAACGQLRRGSPTTASHSVDPTATSNSTVPPAPTRRGNKRGVSPDR